MPRRSNPWPAFVDLFSALLTVTFAGFIMLSTAYEGELADVKKRELEKKEFRERATAVKNKVKLALRIAMRERGIAEMIFSSIFIFTSG